LKRLAALAPGLLFAAGLALYVPRLAYPDRYIFDEVYHAYTAGQYVAGNRDAYVWNTKSPQPHVAYMWNHPPLGVHLISLGIRWWGDHSYGWRFVSVLFGAAGLAVAFMLGRALTGNETVGGLAAGLLMMEGLYFVQARVGMLDVFGTVFMMCALLQFHRFWTTPAARAGPRLALVGIFLGLGVATKWNAAYVSALVGLVAISRAAWTARRPLGEGGARLGPSLFWIAFGLLIVPASVYLLAYVPFFRAGYGWREFWELQRQILAYHSHLTATHPYQSSWWQWPLVLRPVWYHVEYMAGRVGNIYALPNPLVHWALVPAAAWLVWTWARRRDPSWLTLAIGFFGSWLPWALVPRISFAYHFLPAVPFGCVALATLLVRLANGPRAVRWLPWAYGAAVVAAFVFFYPLWTGLPLTQAELAARLWLPRWK
jgi:dolichyl-phosphate-mannose-protein mannosyltransferase